MHSAVRIMAAIEWTIMWRGPPQLDNVSKACRVMGTAATAVGKQLLALLNRAAGLRARRCDPITGHQFSSTRIV